MNLWNDYIAASVMYQDAAKRRESLIRSNHRTSDRDAADAECRDAASECRRTLERWMECRSTESIRSQAGKPEPIRNRSREHPDVDAPRRLSSLSDNERKQIVDRFYAGDPIFDICDDLQIRPNDAFVILHLAGIKIGRNQTVVDTKQGAGVDRNEIIRAYNQGANPKAIAAVLQCSETIVRSVLGRGRITGEVIRRRKHRRWEEILFAFLVECLSVDQIAERFECSRDNVRAHIDRAKENGNWQLFFETHHDQIRKEESDERTG